MFSLSNFLALGCSRLFSALLFNSILFYVIVSGSKLEIVNDGPTTLDTKVTFYVTLETSSVEIFFLYEFRDCLGNLHTQVAGQNLTWGRTYTKSDLGHHRTPYKCIMKVIVKHKESKKEMAKTKTEFLITETLNGNMSIADVDTDVVPVNSTLNVTFSLHDPSGFFSEADCDYAWSFGDVQAFGLVDYFLYNVTKEGTLTIRVVVHARIPLVNSTKYNNKWGFFTKVIRVLAPINNVSISGNVYLKQGDVLYLDITCNGTGPFSYCSRVIPPGVPVPVMKNLTCDPVTYTLCSFHLQHYFPHAGKYTIATLIGNLLGLKQSIINIEIYDVSKKPQLSTIIVPISCSLLAVVIIVVGLAYHVHQRKSYVVEVADFDFQQPLPLNEKSFVEHVKESFKVAYDNCRLGRSTSDEHIRPIPDEDEDERSSGGGSTKSQLLPHSNYGSCI